MPEPNYIVIRDPGNPFDGTWYDLANPPYFLSREGMVVDEEYAKWITYVPTEEIEVREDGAVAQVYVIKRKDN